MAEASRCPASAHDFACGPRALCAFPFCGPRIIKFDPRIPMAERLNNARPDFIPYGGISSAISTVRGDVLYELPGTNRGLINPFVGDIANNTNLNQIQDIFCVTDV